MVEDVTDCPRFLLRFSFLETTRDSLIRQYALPSHYNYERHCHYKLNRPLYTRPPLFILFQTRISTGPLSRLFTNHLIVWFSELESLRPLWTRSSPSSTRNTPSVGSLSRVLRSSLLVPVFYPEVLGHV